MSAAKKNVPRKRSGAYPYAPVSMILNGIKYKPGQKPARVCVPSRPSTASERFMTDALSATADHIRGLLDERAQFRQGRPESAVTGHIRQLVAANPGVKPTTLYKLRDRTIIKSMPAASWRNRVAEARRK